MRIPFRQGIVQHQQPDFFEVKFPYVDLVVVDTPVIITASAGVKDYMHIEHQSVTAAWGPLPIEEDVWLYWDIDTRTGVRTFGTTSRAPHVSVTSPVDPIDNQCWYDVATKTMKAWNGTAWIPRVRVFACKLESASVPVSLSDQPNAFTGTQVGDNSQIFAGQLLFNSENLPIKDLEGYFVTTEDRIRSRLISTADVKVAGMLIEAEATQNLAKYTVVHFSDFGRVEHADSFTAAQQGQFGMIESDVVIGDLVNVVTAGVITNLDWDWTEAGINAYIYCDDAGALITDPIIPDQVPIAIVIDKHCIQLGAPHNNIATTVEQTVNPPTPIMTTTVQGKAVITVPPVNANNPIVVGDNDPRMTNARTPLPHTHPLADITDVTITNVTTGQVLTYDGSKWVNADGGGGESFWEITPHDYGTTTPVAARTRYMIKDCASLLPFTSEEDLAEQELGLNAIPEFASLAWPIVVWTKEGAHDTELHEVVVPTSQLDTVQDYVDHINDNFGQYVNAVVEVDGSYSGITITSVVNELTGVGIVLNNDASDPTNLYIDPLVLATANSPNICSYTLASVRVGVPGGPNVTEESLRPRIQVPAVEEVYLPHHTFIESDEYKPNNNYWSVVLDSSGSDVIIDTGDVDVSGGGNNSLYALPLESTSMRTCGSSVAYGTPDMVTVGGAGSIYSMGTFIADPGNDDTVKTYVEVRHTTTANGGRLKNDGINFFGRIILGYRPPVENLYALPASTTATAGVALECGNSSGYLYGLFNRVRAHLSADIEIVVAGINPSLNENKPIAWSQTIYMTHTGSSTLVPTIRGTQSGFSVSKGGDDLTFANRIVAAFMIEWYNTDTSETTYGYGLYSCDGMSGSTVFLKGFSVPFLSAQYQPVVCEHFNETLIFVGYGNLLALHSAYDASTFVQYSITAPNDVKIWDVKMAAPDPITLSTYYMLAGSMFDPTSQTATNSRYFYLLGGETTWALTLPGAFRPNAPTDSDPNAIDNNQAPRLAVYGHRAYFVAPVRLDNDATKSALFVACIDTLLRQIVWTREIGRFDGSNTVSDINLTNPLQEFIVTGIGGVVATATSLVITYTVGNTTANSTGSNAATISIDVNGPMIGQNIDHFEVRNSTKTFEVDATIDMEEAEQSVLQEEVEETLATETTNRFDVIQSPRFPRQTVTPLPPFGDDAGTLKPSLLVENNAYAGQFIMGDMYPVPDTLQGSIVDRKGMIRADASGLYYCTRDYNGVDNIWKYVPFPVVGKEIKYIAKSPINYPFGMIGDKVGDLRIVDGAGSGSPVSLFYCFKNYVDDETHIWMPITTPDSVDVQTGNSNPIRIVEQYEPDPNTGGLQYYAHSIRQFIPTYRVYSNDTISLTASEQGYHVVVSGENATINLPSTFEVNQQDYVERGWYAFINNTSDSTVDLVNPDVMIDDVYGEIKKVLPHQSLMIVLNDSGAYDTMTMSDLGGVQPFITATSDVFLDFGHIGKMLRLDSSTLVTVNIPEAADTAFPPGTKFEIRQVNTGQISLMYSGALTINIPDGKQGMSAGRGSVITLHYIGNDEWDIGGDLADV